MPPVECFCISSGRAFAQSTKTAMALTRLGGEGGMQNIRMDGWACWTLSIARNNPMT